MEDNSTTPARSASTEWRATRDRVTVFVEQGLRHRFRLARLNRKQSMSQALAQFMESFCRETEGLLSQKENPDD